MKTKNYIYYVKKVVDFIASLVYNKSLNSNENFFSKERRIVMKCLVSLFGVFLFFVTPIAQAEQWNFEGNEDSAWENPNNWSSGLVPTSIISVGIVAPCVSSATGNEAALYLQPQPMEVVSGTLTVDDVHVFGGGNLLISGGAMTGEAGFVGQAPNESGSITVSGGSLTLTGDLYLGSTSQTDSTFSVVGSGATSISMANFIANGGTAVPPGKSTVEFGLDSGGITPITIDPTGYADLDSAIINMSMADPNWYPTYGATYNLITTSGVGSFIEATNMVYDSDSWSLDLTGTMDVDQTLVATFIAVLRLSEPDGDTTVTEGQPGDTYNVVMNTQPGAGDSVTVAIAADPNHLGQVNFAPNPLTFNTANWDQPQLVTVTAVDDIVPENTEVFNIEHTTSGSSDPCLNGKVYLLEITVIDDDEPQILFVESGGSTDVVEGGAGDTYDVYLNGTPGFDVTVSITPDPNEVSVDTPFLIFTPGNAGTPQPVTVTAVDDVDLELEHTGTITHSSTSADSLFDGLIEDLVVNVGDNECGAWGYHPQDLNEDCNVNILDFGEFAIKWLNCSQPYDPACDDLR